MLKESKNIKFHHNLTKNMCIFIKILKFEFKFHLQIIYKHNNTCHTELLTNITKDL
jgi:hypothetical protein